MLKDVYGADNWSPLSVWGAGGNVFLKIIFRSWVDEQDQVVHLKLLYNLIVYRREIPQVNSLLVQGVLSLNYIQSIAWIYAKTLTNSS